MIKKKKLKNVLTVLPIHKLDLSSNLWEYLYGKI